MGCTECCNLSDNMQLCLPLEHCPSLHNRQSSVRPTPLRLNLSTPASLTSPAACISGMSDLRKRATGGGNRIGAGDSSIDTSQVLQAVARLYEGGLTLAVYQRIGQLLDSATCRWSPVQTLGTPSCTTSAWPSPTAAPWAWQPWWPTCRLPGHWPPHCWGLPLRPCPSPTSACKTGGKGSPANPTPCSQQVCLVTAPHFDCLSWALPPSSSCRLRMAMASAD